MTRSLTEAVARALCREDVERHERDEEQIQARVDRWWDLPQWIARANVAIAARDAWAADNAPFEGGHVTQSRLRKLRKIAARPGAGE